MNETFVKGYFWTVWTICTDQRNNILGANYDHSLAVLSDHIEHRPVGAITFFPYLYALQ
ncbi:hypothetical protein KTT_24920 [Tengunoibacter tsumagoiensis]|uniref:Uncharacterized protein n=1 Tax=Tengunoibacter tsumagoiensis TaxID=2014871 RepID=A0A402A0J6_9CHLR|nr:hypothetical protein KTT_24920 [Tengunoibacter tsumagoiensis]